jgi:hypothetical protein
MHRALIGLVVLFTVLCCDSGVVGSSTVLGVYTLRTINDSALPYTIAISGADKTEILDDVITLYEGDTYAESSHLRVTANGQVTNQAINESGGSSLFGTSITLRSADGSRTRIATSTDNNTLTIVQPGQTWVYRK